MKHPETLLVSHSLIDSLSIVRVAYFFFAWIRIDMCFIYSPIYTINIQIGFSDDFQIQI